MTNKLCFYILIFVLDGDFCLFFLLIFSDFCVPTKMVLVGERVVCVRRTVEWNALAAASFQIIQQIRPIFTRTWNLEEIQNTFYITLTLEGVSI